MIHPRMRSRLRRALTAVAVVAFALASLGVSWTAAPRKDRSVPFPCMDRACGCHDAASCKKHCCCFSDAEKLAWAASYRVDPAPFVSSTARPSTPRPQHRSCCDARQPGPSLSASFRAARRPDGALRVVSIAAQRQCQGLAQLWSVLAAALPSVGATRYEFDWVCTGLVALRSPTPIQWGISPPTPPPRG
jgi:hypothetical protein